MATSQIKSLPPSPPPNIGAPFYAEFSGVTIPGTEQTLMSITVPLLTIRTLYHLSIRCNMACKWVLMVGSSIVASGRANAAYPESEFYWYPGRATFPGDVIQLKFTGQVGFPAVDIEAYLQAADIT